METSSRNVDLQKACTRGRVPRPMVLPLHSCVMDRPATGGEIPDAWKGAQ
jgi:hypothetical protein